MKQLSALENQFSGMTILQQGISLMVLRKHVMKVSRERKQRKDLRFAMIQDAKQKKFDLINKRGVLFRSKYSRYSWSREI